MDEIVYLFGAGANQSIRYWNNISPPMSKNFFKTALKMRRFPHRYYVDKFRIVYDYIEKYWNKDINKLAETSFYLEECFTSLDQRMKRAKKETNIEEFYELWNVQFLLKALLAEVLKEFELFVASSGAMLCFGRLLNLEKPNILNFNYDCIIETVIEFGSGLNPSIPKGFPKRPPRDWPWEAIKVTDDELPYSNYNWNRPLGYGIFFDEIQLQRLGLSTYVRGDRFYAHPKNELYPGFVLKLHGSLNWFQYLSFDDKVAMKYPHEHYNFTKNLEDLILINGQWWMGEPPDLDGYILDPLIITPTLYKDEYYERRPFVELWKMAKDVLLKCKKLIIIGYSFGPTDFSTKLLFRDVFSNHKVEELIVVNPDESIVQIVKDLCHFSNEPTHYRCLEEYLREHELIDIHEKKIFLEEFGSRTRKK